MKKIMALLVAVVMIFSVAAIPASAALADSAQAVTDSFNAGDYFTAIENVFVFAQDLINAIHDLVGGIMAVVGQECAFCETIHTVEIAPAA